MSLRIVIDPGHGGDSLGGNTDEYIEKYLDAKVADYMKERLSQYDGVEVFLTRTDPDAGELSIKDRVKIAADHNADFLFSIHFNMSVDHDLYGSEVWVSAFGDYYRQGKDFADIEMEGLTSLGFFDRGIKTKIGKEGTDYYGIMRYACESNIPAVIIEHCHMDESRDTDILKAGGEELYKTLGYLDADSVAKFYHLTSSSLGIDYSNYTYDQEPLPASVVMPDLTAPSTCDIELISSDTAGGEATVKITAADNESILQYYKYSLNGGNTYSKLYPWNDDNTAKAAAPANSITITVPLSDDGPSDLIVAVCNRFDLATTSNTLSLPAKEKKIDRIPEDKLLEYDSISYNDNGMITENITSSKDGTNSAGDTYTEVSSDTAFTKSSGNTDIILFVLFAAIGLAAILTLGIGIYVHNTKKRRRKRRH